MKFVDLYCVFLLVICGCNQVVFYVFDLVEDLYRIKFSVIGGFYNLR